MTNKTIATFEITPAIANRFGRLVPETVRDVDEDAEDFSHLGVEAYEREVS